MNKKGNLVIISGPSGSGKGTILTKFLSQNHNAFLSISATTRSPRPGEKDGKDYFFLDKQEFKDLIKKDGMLEYASYCNNYYGTPQKYVDDHIINGKNVILEIEVQGALQVKTKLPEAISVFIAPPSIEELEKRLKGRETESVDAVQARLKTAKDEMQLANEYDYIIINNSVEQAVSDLENIFKKL